jgi:hypothetical protein
MQQSFATVIAAVIAVAGVLVGIVAGTRRWRAERREAKSADYAKGQRDAYTRMWELVEGFHIALRTDDLTENDIRERIRDTNAQLLREGIYLASQDRELFATYMKAVWNVKRLVDLSADERASRDYGTTSVDCPLPTEMLAELGKAQRGANALREGLIYRIRLVLTGETVT